MTPYQTAGLSTLEMHLLLLLLLLIPVLNYVGSKTNYEQRNSVLGEFDVVECFILYILSYVLQNCPQYSQYSPSL